jgi:hypothetical protein
MRLWLQISNNILFVYYLFSNLIYLALLVTAIFRNTWQPAPLGQLAPGTCQKLSLYASNHTHRARAQRRNVHH